jgi:hypothetical protein
VKRFHSCARNGTRLNHDVDGTENADLQSLFWFGPTETFPGSSLRLVRLLRSAAANRWTHEKPRDDIAA